MGAQPFLGKGRKKAWATKKATRTFSANFSFKTLHISWIKA